MPHNYDIKHSELYFHIVNAQHLVCISVVSQMQRMINQIGGQMDNLELRDKLYDSEFFTLFFFVISCKSLKYYKLFCSDFFHSTSPRD